MSSLAVLPLPTQPLNVEVGKRQLNIVKADDKVLVVEFPIGNTTQAQRQYTLSDTRFLVKYPFGHNNARSAWVITVIPNPRCDERIHHEFRSREAAFAFQRYVTGYAPDQYCERADCSATIVKILRNSTYKGSGEVQLWCPDELCESTPVGPSEEYAPSSTSSRVSIRSSTTFMTATAVPVFERKNVKTYVNRHRPPLLVAFLRDEGREICTMLKVNRKQSPVNSGIVTDLVLYKELSDQPDRLTFQRNSGFTVWRLAAANEHHQDWDVRALATNKGPTLESTKFASLTVSGLSPDKLQQFRNRMEELQLQYRDLQEERALLKDLVSRGDELSLRSSRHRRTSSVSSFFSTVLPLAGDNSPPASPRELHSVPVPERHELSPNYPPSEDYYTSPTLAAQDAEPQRQRTQQPFTIPLNTPAGTETRLRKSSGRNLRRNHNTSTEPTIANQDLTFPAPDPDCPSENGPSDNQCRDNSTVFADLDGRIARFMLQDPSLCFSSSSAEVAIKTLHSLPGGARALLYDFGSSSRSRGKELEDTATNSRFRCPFDIVHPGAERHVVSCQGPGFYPLSDLWDHLEQYHQSYDCYTCLEDCRDSDGIMSHISRGCITPPTIPPKGIPFMKFQEVRKALVDIRGGNGMATPEVQQEERWNRMWEILFPMFREQQPSPYFDVPEVAYDPDLARLQLIFAAMVHNDPGIDGDENGGMVTKENAKRYLHAAIQVFLGESVAPWPGPLAESWRGTT